jgi:hypothetical protein
MPVRHFAVGSVWRVTSGSTNTTTTPSLVRDIASTTMGGGQITVSWRAPVSNGGAAITGYAVTATHANGSGAVGASVAGSATQATITGLSNSYTTVSVVATNGVGSSNPAYGLIPILGSYWQTGFPITHGYELATDGITYSDRRAVRAGIPPGAMLAPSGGLTISAPGIYTDLDISGNLVIAANDVKLLRVRVCTGSFYALRCNGYTGFEAVDCEFSGGRASTVNARGRFVRCLAFDGDDLLRPTGDQFEWVESVAWWPLRDSPSSHSDALQFTSNGGMITGVVIERSLLSSWKPETTDYMNAAIQTGDFKNPDGTIIGGVHGSVTDCFFDGGNYTVNAGGAANRPEVRMTYTGNRWGLKARYGPAQAVNTNVVWDNTNVFHQTGTTTYEHRRSVTAGQAVL